MPQRLLLTVCTWLCWRVGVCSRSHHTPQQTRGVRQRPARTSNKSCAPQSHNRYPTRLTLYYWTNACPNPSSRERDRTVRTILGPLTTVAHNGNRHESIDCSRLWGGCVAEPSKRLQLLVWRAVRRHRVCRSSGARGGLVKVRQPSYSSTTLLCRRILQRGIKRCLLFLLSGRPRRKTACKWVTVVVHCSPM